MERKRKTTFRLRRSHPFGFLAVNKRVNFFIIGRGNHPPVSTRGKSGKSKARRRVSSLPNGRKEKVAMRKVIYNLQRRKKRRSYSETCVFLPLLRFPKPLSLPPPPLSYFFTSLLFLSNSCLLLTLAGMNFPRRRECTSVAWHGN